MVLRGEIKTPPMSEAARREAGFLIRRLQQGENLGLPHSRPMPDIGPRCHELRVNDTNKTWRVIYRIDHDAVVVADVFEKKHANRSASADDRVQTKIIALRPSRWRRTMKLEKKRRLEAAGWKETTVQEFLNLSDADAQYIETKLALSRQLRQLREKHHLTQTKAATLLKTSQSRLARMEAGDPSVSLDLLVRGLFALGATWKELGKAT